MRPMHGRASSGPVELTPEELRDGMKRPVASQRKVKELVRKYGRLLGFGHPFKVTVVFHNCRKQDFCDTDDVHCYACCEVQPQYLRATLHFDLYHPRWLEADEELEECIRHELGHAMVATYTQAASHLTESQEIMKVLADLEDDLVQRIAAMPVWKRVEELEEE